jgi:hypothetical protein
MIGLHREWPSRLAGAAAPALLAAMIGAVAASAQVPPVGPERCISNCGSNGGKP